YYTVTPGARVEIPVAAADPDSGDDVTLTVQDLPAGATLTPAAPLTGNPVRTVFSWTPSEAQLGVSRTNFVAQDRAGGETRLSLVLEVKNTGFSYSLLDLGTRAHLSGVSFLNPSFGCVTGPGGLLLTTR